MRPVRLGDIAESLPCDYGDDPVADAPSFDVVKVSNIDGEGQFHRAFEKRRFGEDQLANLLVNEGELLVVKSSGSKANILSGKTAICGSDLARRIVASNFLLRLRVDDARALPRFVWYVLNSGASKAFVKTIVGASTYPNLKWSLFSSFQIPLPPLSEQQRIAAILDKADALRAKRCAALTQLDTLTQSIFLDMFGDPVTNPKGWPLAPLPSVIYFQEGPGIRNWQFRNEGIKLVNVKNIVDGRLITENTERHLDPLEVEKRYKRFLLSAGDFVVASSGVTWGKIAEVEERHLPLCLNTSMIRFRPLGGGVEKRFIRAFVESPAFRRQILRLITGSAQPNFGPAHLKQVRIPLPPISVQHEYARRATAVDELKTADRASLEELDALFASLQHRAFRGAL